MLHQQEFLVPLTKCLLQTADNPQFGRRILHLKRDTEHRMPSFFRAGLPVVGFLAVLPQKVPVMERLAEGTGIRI
jgi:hypothetical protein